MTTAAAAAAALGAGGDRRIRIRGFQVQCSRSAVLSSADVRNRRISAHQQERARGSAPMNSTDTMASLTSEQREKELRREEGADATTAYDPHVFGGPTPTT